MSDDKRHKNEEQEPQEQTEAEHRAEVARKGHQAKALLEHPLTAEWLEEEKQCALLAFKRLPMPATMREYLAAQAYVHALERLEADLRAKMDAHLRMQEEMAEEEREESENLWRQWDFDPNAPY